MNNVNAAIIQSVSALLLATPGAWRATKYLGPNSIVRATRRRQRGKIANGTIDIRLTIGRPNAAERLFLKRYRKRLPGTHPSHVLIKMLPVPRKKKGRK